jgi:exodeoxyribonuclease-3
MKTLSWNINSLRLRLPQLAVLIADQQPDVLCLQETKVQDGDFPNSFFLEHGYHHLQFAGIKSYNGVAIASRLPISQPQRHDWCQRLDARHVSVTVDGIRLHNIYIPAGGDVPDAAINDKFAHKLQFYAELADWFAAQPKPLPPTLLVGDLNVAPLPDDVWNHKQLLTVVCHTPVEVAAYDKLQQASGLVDAVRHLTPPPTKLFSWWSYRAQDWQASNRGRRIDHAWLSPDLLPRLHSATILVQQRGSAQPSDHVPVVVQLAK